MPIERKGKHWCNPAAETPDEQGQWECPCGTVWVFWPGQQTWAEEGVDLTPQPEPEPLDVPTDEEGEG
jgi:hypothetical protein